MNRTQCPRCFTIFIISDEQIRASKGTVRCGNCRERFHVSLLGEAIVDKSKPNYPSLKLMTEEITPKKPGVIDRTITEFTSKKDFEQHETPPEEPDPLFEITTDAQKDPQTEIELTKEVDHLIDSKLIKQKRIEQSTANKEPLANKEPSPNEDNSTNDMADKESQANAPELNLPFSIEKKSNRRAAHWLTIIILFLFSLVLITALAYQLWFKQWLNLDDNSSIQKIINQSIVFTNQRLKEFDIQLPQRRKLQDLTLLSAQLEPHPTQSSTSLLRISLINRADIAQPLPWLELSLTNAEGRVIARRSLDPDSYLYNNRTNDQIRSNEVKKVTIELVSFPKKAAGYELKIIDK